MSIGRDMISAVQSILGPYGFGACKIPAMCVAAEADARIAELEVALAERDTEIVRLRDALDLSALEYADLTVSARSLEEHLHALVEVSEDSTIARARAVMNGDDIGEDEDEARADNGGDG